MIYFSATGNCKYVAYRIKEALEDKMKSVSDFILPHDKRIDLRGEKYIGFIFSVYGWTIAKIVQDFFAEHELLMEQDSYVFFIITYGTTPGVTRYIYQKIMKQKGVSASFYSIKMVDTWTPIFNLQDKQKIARIENRSELEINEVISQIRNYKKNKHMKHEMPSLFLPVAKKYYESLRKTKNLHVLSSCIGCGLCARNCPIKAIKIEDKKPVWVESKCQMCLKCLHHCPKMAIYYGNGKSLKHGQYHNPNAKTI